MRLVMAILKPSQVEGVRQALAEVDVARLTVCDAQGYGAPPADAVVQQAVMEIAVNEDFLNRTVTRIAAALAAEGDDAERRLFVLPMDDAVQLYREVRGPEAV